MSTNDQREIAVIICTHNRAELLMKNLQTLEQQTLSPDRYEVIIVDNASNDETSKFVQEWCQGKKHYSYIHEPKLGLSYARNLGYQKANSPIVVYLDDDAFPEPQWLSSILKRFETDDSIAAVGGPIYLSWEGGKPPAWVSPVQFYAYGYQHYGELPKPVKHINGGNMALKTRILLESGGFNPVLGRKGEKLLAGEESHFFSDFHQSGKIVFYEPNAIVHHFISKKRQRPLFISKVYFNIGISEIIRTEGKNKLYRLFRHIKLMPEQIRREVTSLENRTIQTTSMVITCNLLVFIGLSWGSLIYRKILSSK